MFFTFHVFHFFCLVAFYHFSFFTFSFYIYFALSSRSLGLRASLSLTVICDRGPGVFEVKEGCHATCLLLFAEHDTVGASTK